MNWTPDKPIHHEYDKLAKNTQVFVQTNYSDRHSIWAFVFDYEPNVLDVAIWRVKSLKPKP